MLEILLLIEDEVNYDEDLMANHPQEREADEDKL